MLPAKLFAALAAMFTIIAGVAHFRPSPGIDLYVHANQFALEPIHVLLFCIVSCANFGVLYYAGDRILHVRWNRTLSLLHFSLFLCFAISFSMLFGVTTRAANGLPPGQAMDWIILPCGFLGIFSLVAGFVVFAINLITVIIQLLRPRTVSR